VADSLSNLAVDLRAEGAGPAVPGGAGWLRESSQIQRAGVADPSASAGAAAGGPGPEGALGDGPAAACHVRPTAAPDEPGGPRDAPRLCALHGRQGRPRAPRVHSARPVGSGWRFVELAAAHSAHVTAPRELVDVPAQLAQRGVDSSAAWQSEWQIHSGYCQSRYQSTSHHQAALGTTGWIWPLI
jgi:hypothetical protein